jgi:hypothetical protein
LVNVPAAAAEAARADVRALAAWAERDLALQPSAFRGCTGGELAELCDVGGVEQLPAAYDEFMRLMGHGGVGSVLFEIFPGDDVAWDSMMPSVGWLGARRVAEEIIGEQSYDLDLAGNYVVIHMRRASEIEYVPIFKADPPVWGFGEGGRSPHPVNDSFTEWLERRIGRAIKRRYPLRDAHFAD